MNSRAARGSQRKAVAGVGLFFLGVIFYLIDCALAHGGHPEISWLMSGVYAGGLFGFGISLALIFIGAILSLYFLVKCTIQKNKE